MTAPVPKATRKTRKAGVKTLRTHLAAYTTHRDIKRVLSPLLWGLRAGQRGVTYEDLLDLVAERALAIGKGEQVN